MPRPFGRRNDKASPFGAYEVVRELGRGATSVVYLARQTSLNRLVALKSIQSKDVDVLAFVTGEAAVLADMQHPHIVQVLDSSIDANGQPFLVMPFMAGGSLRRLLQRDHVLSPAQAVAVLSALADALDALHRRSFVHRDVKPENVHLSAGGDVFLGDLGTAVSSTADDALFVGTPGYIAPEVLRGDAYTAAADTFALGALGRELLTGSASGGFIDESVPRALLNLVEQATAEAASERPVDLRLWANELRSACTSAELHPDVIDLAATVDVAADEEIAGTIIRKRAGVATGSAVVATNNNNNNKRRALVATGIAAAIVLIGGVAWATTGSSSNDDKPDALAADLTAKSGEQATSTTTTTLPAGNVSADATPTTVSIPSDANPVTNNSAPIANAPVPTTAATSHNTTAVTSAPPATRAPVVTTTAKPLQRVNAATYNIYDPGPSAWNPLPVSGGSFIEQRFVSTVDFINELGVDTFGDAGKPGPTWRVSLLDDNGTELAAASVATTYDLVSKVSINPVAVKRGAVYRVRAAPPWNSTDQSVWTSPGDLYPPGEANRNGTSLAGVDNRWTAKSDAGLYAAGYRLE